MKSISLFLLLVAAFNTSSGQGSFAGDISFSIDGGVTKICDIEVQIYSDEPFQHIVVDWGDGSAMDTLFGPSFFVAPDYYVSIYDSYHIYQDTGRYTFRCIGGNWPPDMTNMEDSANQPFVLEAEVWAASDPNLSNNVAPYLIPTADLILRDGGVIRHVIVVSDYDADSTAQKLVLIPVPGYFLPEATDTLACCLLWDMPTTPGRYAFAIEVEDWRFGKNLSRKQRFVSVVVDTIYSNNMEKDYLGDSFVLYPNPTTNNLHILFKGAFIIGSDYIVEIKDAMGRSRFVKPIDMLDYGGGIMVDVKDYLPGLYYVTLKANHGSWTKKIVVGW